MSERSDRKRRRSRSPDKEPASKRRRDDHDDRHDRDRERRHRDERDRERERDRDKEREHDRERDRDRERGRERERNEGRRHESDKDNKASDMDPAAREEQIRQELEKKKKQEAIKARMSAWKKTLPKSYLFASDEGTKTKLTKVDFSQVHKEQEGASADAMDVIKPKEKPEENPEEKRDAMEVDTNTNNDVDALEAFMMGITSEVKELTQKSIMKARKEAGQKTDVSIMDEFDDEEEDGEKKPEDADRERRIAQRRRVLEGIDHSKVAYMDFQKAFYQPVPELAKLTSEEIHQMRKELDDIKIRGKSCPAPVRHFAQCGFNLKIMAALAKNEFEKPTPVQAQALPAVMSGRDVIGIAKTGSGKTLAFLLPMFRHIQAQPPLSPADGPIALIMAPTRELAYQIHKDIKKFERWTKIRSVCVYGGAGVQHQIGDLKRGAEVVVCTPGRMIDVLTSNKGRVTNLRRVTYLVLDEADRMFDMGFEPQIAKIIQNIRPDRQVVLFSATFPRTVESAARRILKNPVELTVRGTGIVADTIEQHVEVLPTDKKVARLMQLVSDWYEKGSILIFVDRQEDSDILWREILRSGYQALSLHGGKDQFDRDNVLKEFKSGECKILVATSVAARGLDVPSIRLVVNYDVPNHLEDYVHRVGRTGRAGNTGTAYTFISPGEEQYSRDIVHALKSGNTPVPEALQKMFDDFETKRKAGVAKKHKSGFTTGSGFKFDEEEERQKADRIKREKIALGLADEDDEAQYYSEDEDFADSAASVTVQHDTLATGGDETRVTADELLKTKELLEKAPEKEKPDEVKIANTKEEARKRAMEIASQIAAQFSKKDATKFMEELEINDYPQGARWEVTGNENRARLSELINCDLTIRGVYVPPGKTPTFGERKLYVEIAGSSQQEARQGRQELKRRLDEAALTARPDTSTYSRYTVI